MVLFSRKGCHVCQEVHPLLEEISEDYADTEFSFYNVGVDEQKDLFQKMALKGVPQALFFQGGEQVARISGKQNEDVYIEKIHEIHG